MSKRKVLLGLIGTNIMGSLSPALFADAFVAAGINANARAPRKVYKPGSARCGLR
jgi:shikimate 5-dehydrogenase